MPKIGDFMAVADSLATPPPGQGYYYVTAATYQGQTRFGRKTTARRLEGRDPVATPLPAVIGSQRVHGDESVLGTWPR